MTPQNSSLLTLKNGTIVKVYCADITRTNVDVIVNAANDGLVHSGGIARAISDAAGKALQDDCDKYIKENGEIEVSQLVVTRAGNLPYRHVIHAVGPMWKGLGSSEMTQYLLEKTFINVFTCANVELSMSTLALPLISSGMLLMFNFSSITYLRYVCFKNELGC